MDEIEFVSLPAVAVIARGGEAVDLPPGQYLARDFPVLSAGPTPRIELDTWKFTITTETGAEHNVEGRNRVSSTWPTTAAHRLIRSWTA